MAPKRRNKKNKRSSPSQSSSSSSKRSTSWVPDEDSGSDIDFDDPNVDEFEKEHIVNPDGSERMDLDDDDNDDEDEVDNSNIQVWRPGMAGQQEPQALEHDSSAYTCFHRLNVEWPFLSFDWIRDNLGMHRKKWPQTVYFAGGTQSTDGKNKVSLLKVEDLHRTKHDDDSDAGDDSDDDLDGDPIIVERFFRHPGCVNRLRVCPQVPHIMATWSDLNAVHVWSYEHELKALDHPPTTKLQPIRPVHSHRQYEQEGFALDWSPTVPGRLLSGSCDSNIFLWNRTESGWTVDSTPCKGHTDSVEDVQWSPTEADVFASCSVDKTIKIWDGRQKKAALSVVAHTADVNVISWNRNPNAGHLLVSGSDDHSFKIWDLRNLSAGKPAANFAFHQAPITSVEWHPTEESTLVVSSADHQTTFWDLALENDPEAVAQGGAMPSDLPPQLLFMHCGQNDVKETRWHPQVTSLCLSTAGDGVNIFKPDNL